MSQSNRVDVPADRARHASSYPSVVYLYLVNYGRTKADSIHHAISGFLSVSTTQPLPLPDVEPDSDTPPIT
jgi:hypothetical protein